MWHALLARRRRIKVPTLLATLSLIVSISLVASTPSSEAATCSLSQKLIPSCGVLYGVYSQARSGETAQQAVIRFEREVGAKQRIVHFYHRSGQFFPTPREVSLANGGRKLLLNWKPEGKYTWAEVATGRQDAYIDREASYIKAHYTKPFYLAIHHEPEDEVKSAVGSGYTAKDYRAMYRHIVNRLRAKGVMNAVMVMNYMGFQGPVKKPWFKELWPGNQYVDWVAYDPYASTPLLGTNGGMDWLLDAHWGSGFPGMYKWIVRNHPGKPIMLAEWGVGVKPGDASYKPDFFKSVPGELKNYPALKALVYFDVPGPGDIPVDTSTSSEHAYRTMLNSPTFTRVNM